MKRLAIKAENISKQYRLGQIGTGTLSHDLNRFWHKLRGKPDPYLRIGEANDRSKKGDSDYVWSLKDINFEIEQGDTVGIIGRNGAGKSTLLKILSKVTQPTTGSIKVNGRVASLLEVGTGFHPEMTGRENIYMNGAILGMRKKEIDRKLDEIIDFSGVERYIDTPVKRYSSGMYVRLAFAVAAHLESEILIVDEVLAVGDAEFQKKCLGKMGEVSKGEGRTVLFVSHNMAAIKQLCENAILLQNGRINLFDKTSKVADVYKFQGIKINEEINEERNEVFQNSILKINKVEFLNENNRNTYQFSIGQVWKIKINITFKVEISDVIVGIGISDSFGAPINTSWIEKKSFTKGTYNIFFTEKNIIYSTGIYGVSIGISRLKESLCFLEFNETLLISEDIYNLSPNVVNTKSGLILNQSEYFIESL